MTLAVAGCAAKIPMVVSDCQTKQPIPSADIRVEVDAVPSFQTRTDGSGRALVVRPSSDATVLHVSAKGYGDEDSVYGTVEHTPVNICLERQ